MHTRLREPLNVGELIEVKLPYEITVTDYGITTRYDRIPAGYDVLEINIHVVIFDTSKKYLCEWQGLTEKLHGGCYTIHDNTTIDHAIKIAKMDAMRELARNSDGHETIYSCAVKNPSAFLNKKENLHGSDTEKSATGKVVIFEARIL